jgi:hypothetical protein
LSGYHLAQTNGSINYLIGTSGASYPPRDRVISIVSFDLRRKANGLLDKSAKADKN